MSLAEEASRSVQGAWGLLRRDPAAPQAFNATLSGVWRSYVAALLLLPLNLLHLLEIGPVPGTELAAPATRWALEFFAYVIAWAGWALLAFYLTRLLGCADRLFGYLVAYNWSQLITGPLLIGIDLLARNALPEAAAAALGLAGLIGVLAYEYLIARQMLGVAARPALLMVMSSLLLVLILRDLVNQALLLVSGTGTA